MSANLDQKWTFGETIGGGGFARVVKAFDLGGVAHAAKFVKKEPRASREMLLANLGGVRNVVPVIDSGEIGDEYVLVMPMAEMSLRDYLDENAPLSLAEALKVLKDVATALADLDGKVVHRDLKPENILLLNGVWCLADFGISRYAEAATEPGVTRKGALSPWYAAPEQWRGERANAPTDVYAFGVMAFELLEGDRPFKGDVEMLQDDHLHADPPKMTVGTTLRSLVLECLYKQPQARPSAANLVLKLDKAQSRAEGSQWERLSAANYAEVERRVAADTATARERSERQRRDGLFDAAIASWTRISDHFHDLLGEYLSTADVTVRGDKHWNVDLNGARLGLSHPVKINNRVPDLPFDVIATATLAVVVPADITPEPSWVGRSHSLYFADAFDVDRYMWFETAFMSSVFERRSWGGGEEQVPYAINDLSSSYLHEALGNVVGLCQVAWPFTPVDPGDCDDIAGRWLGWFADASRDSLTRPSRLPEVEVPHNWRGRGGGD